MRRYTIIWFSTENSNWCKINKLLFRSRQDLLSVSLHKWGISIREWKACLVEYFCLHLRLIRQRINIHSPEAKLQANVGLVNNKVLFCEMIFNFLSSLHQPYFKSISYIFVTSCHYIICFCFLIRVVIRINNHMLACWIRNYH